MIGGIANGGAMDQGNSSRLKLGQAAREFESMLITDLLKMAEHDKKTDDPGSQGYDDMRVQAIASEMAARGGLGIAQMILSKLDRREPANIKAFSSSADSQIARDY